MRGFLVVLMMAVSGFLAAEQTNYGTAGVAAPWLKLANSARVAALAEAGSALTGDLSCLGGNPAGLASLDGMNATFTHNAWIQESSNEHVAFGMNAIKGLGAAVSFDYLNMGKIPRYRVDGNTLVHDGDFTPSALRVDLGAGYSLAGVSLGGFALDGLRFGLAGRMLSQTIDSQSSSAFAMDLGALYTLKGVSGGLAVQHMGSQLDGSDLPRNVKAGLGYRVALDQDGVNLAADLNYPLADGKATSVSLGGEYDYRGLFAARLGYKIQDRGDLGGVNGLTAGIGGKYQWISLDYAFTAMGDLGNGNMITLGAKF